ncbi:unnamed protein product [Ectocarpus sp. 6 AP-2014]
MAAPMDSAEGGSDYYDSGGEQGNDLGDVMKENPSLWAMFIMAYLVVWVQGLAFSSTCFNRSRFYRGGLCMQGHNPISRVIFVPFLVLVVVPAFGIFTAPVMICWLLCRVCFLLGRVDCHFPAGWLMRPPQRRRHLSNFPSGRERRWKRRGWLVMLRARHQIFLAQLQQNDSQPWLCKRKLRDLCGITRVMTADDPLATAGSEPSVGAPGIADIELYEQGTYDQEFAQAVVSVAGVMEEGIFRGITLYL